MNRNALNIVGGGIIVGGLMATAFFAGSMGSGGSSSVASVKATATPVKQLIVTKEDEKKDLVKPIVSPETEKDPVADPTAPATPPPGSISNPAPVQPQVQEPQPVEATPVPPAPTLVPTAVPPTATAVPPTATPEPTATAVPNEAPYIVSVSPVDGATGEQAGTNVVVTFSEPMDKADVQAAFNISKGNPGTFLWNDEVTKMTFKPVADYGFGDQVNWSISKTAADLAGLGMDEDASGSFKVMNKSVMMITGQSAYDGDIKAVGFGFAATTNSQSIRVSSSARGYLSFHLGDLPDDLIAIHNATLKFYQTDHDAGAYTNTTGGLMVETLSYGQLHISDWWLAPHPFCDPISILCPLAITKKLVTNSSADGWKSVEVTSALWSDWAKRDERAMRSQFRLSFAQELGGDIGIDINSASAASDRPHLMITYTHH